MMLEKYNNWLNSVKQLNNDAQRVSDDRNDCYKWMSKKIKEAFQRNGMPAPKIHFTSNCSRIECCWSRSVELLIPPSLILDLHMPFDLDVEIMADGEWRKKLTFYPLKED